MKQKKYLPFFTVVDCANFLRNSIHDSNPVFKKLFCLVGFHKQKNPRFRGGLEAIRSLPFHHPCLPASAAWQVSLSSVRLR